MAGAGIKRAASVDAAGPAKKPLTTTGVSSSNSMSASPISSSKLTVTTQSNKKDDIGIATLLGDFVEEGTNHNRKYFRKVQAIPGHKDIKVFLYFWDGRDGADFSGWWFGDQLGGTQVWARNPAQSATPPRIGWRIPWDAEKPEPGILLVEPSKATGQASTTPGASAPASSSVAKPAAAQASNPTLNDEKVKKATAQVESAIKGSDATLAKFKSQVTATASETMIKAAEETVKKQQASLMEIQKTITEDIAAVRKAGGPSANGIIGELTKLSTKLRSSQVALAQETTKLKTLMVQASANSAKSKDDEKQKEATDAKDLQTVLPACKEIVSAAEDAVEAIGLMASPLLAEPPEPNSEILQRALAEIETSAKDAQEKINEARKQVNQKQSSCKTYAPETRKTATTEFAQLQQKLSEAQKKLSPFKTFKKDFQSRVAAKKALQEIVDKIAAAEADTEKATLMSTATDAGAMTEEEVSSTEKLVTPVLNSLAAALRLAAQKEAGADAVTKDELQQLKSRGAALKAKLLVVQNQLKEQKQSISARQVASQASQKVDAAEAELAKCQEAEMPFLKGIEVLPAEESTKALGDSEVASAAADKALSQALVFIKQKMSEANGFVSKTLSKATLDELKQVQLRADAISKKLTDFKKETAERKMAAVLAEAMDAIKSAEKKVAAYGQIVKPCLVESLADIKADAVRSAVEASPAAYKEAQSALGEARKVLMAKQKDAQKDGKNDSSVASLGKLTARLNMSQGELAKYLKANGDGEKLLKGKELITEEEERMKQTEGTVEKVEALMGPDLSDEAAQQLGDTIVAAEKALKDGGKSIEAAIAGAMPLVKAALLELKERNKKATQQLATVLAATKDLREKVLGEAYLREGRKKVASVEAALEKVSEAELPFLKGIEILPLQEASTTLAASDAAAEEVQAALAEARAFTAAKNAELKSFSKEAAAKLTEEFAKLTERITQSTSKLNQFRKDTDGRKKTAQMQELGEKLDAAEAAVTDFVAAVEPFSTADSEDSMVGDAAEALHEKIAQLATVAQELIDASRTMLTSRQRDAKGNAGLTEMVTKLAARFGEVNKNFVAGQKVYSNHEQKYVAKRLVQQAEDLIASLEATVKKATDACAPLLDNQGESFLVSSSLSTFATALHDVMKSKSMDQAALFASMGGKAKGLSKEDFLKYLAEAASTKEELGFADERREAMFKYLDKDEDGFLSLPEFQAIFQRHYACIKSISITDLLEISKSKTVGKLEAKEVVEALGEAVMDEAAGMLRIECRIGDRSGWVTMKGNQGTVFLESWSRFAAFSQEVETIIQEQYKELMKISQTLKVMSADLAAKAGQTSGPLADARTELNKLRPKIMGAQNSMDQLKRKVAASKKDFAAKEAAEKTAHIEAKEQKEADDITKRAQTALEATEALGKRLEDIASPLVSLEASQRDTFPTPASTLEEAESVLASMKESAIAARTCIKEQQAKLGAATTGPLSRAKPELSKMLSKVEAALRKATGNIDNLRKACAAIVSARLAQVSTSLRDDVQKRNISLEALFKELAKGDRIEEAVFCKRLQSLEGLELTSEQALLVCRRIEAGGICKRKFLNFLQKYFSVVKAIAMTDEFDINKAKTIRKAEVDEIVEVLEGPRKDEKLGLTRIRCRSLVDSLEGWVTVQGNQGTPFLKEVEKPYYVCNAEVPLDGDSSGNSRTLKPDEVLELLEGPRTQAVARTVRIRVTTGPEKVSGWLTVKDKHGTVFAQADQKTYCCLTSVALTDVQDMKDCKVVRKLVVGELIAVTEGPVVEKEGVSRVKGKCLADGLEGWLTTKGNAGTVYAEASSKHYTIVQEVALQSRFQSVGAEAVRQLAAGEIVQVMEGPKEEAVAPEVRAKVRSVLDNTAGWVSVKAPAVQKWNSFYKCLVASPLHETSQVSEASAPVRELSAGEVLEFLEGPALDGDTMRIKCRAKKDGAIGWAALRSEGKKLLSC